MLYALGRISMDRNLYFKSNKFNSNKALADYVYSELKKLSFVTLQPIDNDYMFVIPVHINNSVVDVFLGKNDEESDVTLWQIWPEIQISFLRKIFTKVDKSSELLVANEIERIVNNIDGVSDVEWGI